LNAAPDVPVIALMEPENLPNVALQMAVAAVSCRLLLKQPSYSLFLPIVGMCCQPG